MRRLALLLPLLAACAGSSAPQPPPGGADLSGFDTARITVEGVEFEVWLAKSFAQQQQGLMFAEQSQLDPLPDGTERGMLFIFGGDAFLSFWMRNTFVPLDLAYIRADGTIAEIHELVPLDETRVVAGEPVRYALELPRGTLAGNGLDVGDTVVIPPSALN